MQEILGTGAKTKPNRKNRDYPIPECLNDI